jgi:hypothetical protein
MKNILVLLFLFLPQVLLAQTDKREFEPFYSARVDIAGGGSNMKYQNKQTGQIDTSESKKMMNMSVRFVRLSSENFRWYFGVLLEDYSFKNINMTNELTASGFVGLGYSLGDLHLSGDFLAYQHMDFNSLGDIYRKLDPAFKFDWRYDLITFNKNVLGFGQAYLFTTPIPQMTNDPYAPNKETDYDILSQIYYRQVFIKNSLEFYLQHDFKVIENFYYRGEQNNLNLGIRLSFPFQ